MSIFLVLLQKLKDFIGLEIFFIAFLELLLDKHFIRLKVNFVAFVGFLLLLGLKVRFCVALFSFRDFVQSNKVHRVWRQSFREVIIFFGIDFIRKEVVFGLRRHVIILEDIDSG